MKNSIFINYHGMDGKNALFSEEENLIAKEITESYMQNNYLTKKTNVKTFQTKLDEYYKKNKFFNKMVTDYKIEDVRFYFKSEKAYENYKFDKKLLTSVTEKDINFLNAFKENISLLPDLFGEKTLFEPENNLNILTFMMYKKEYRNLLEKNDELAKSGLPYIPLSVENIMNRMGDYYKTSELGNILSAAGPYFDNEKNKNYGLADFIKSFKTYTVNYPEYSEDSIIVMKTLFKDLSNAQKKNINDELHKNGITDKKLKSFLDKENSFYKKDKEFTLDRR